MQGNLLFEYAIIRIVPKVEREEFLNVGVVLYCKDKKFLRMIHKLDENKLSAFPGIDIQEIQDYLCAFERICQANADAGTIAKLPIDERFRWLTASRSTIVQSSKVHPGLCDNPEAMLNKLFEQMVL